MPDVTMLHELSHRIARCQGRIAKIRDLESPPPSPGELWTLFNEASKLSIELDRMRDVVTFFGDQADATDPDPTPLDTRPTPLL